MAYLQTLLSNLVQAALRLMPLGQTAGQRVLRDLGPRIAALVGAVLPARPGRDRRRRLRARHRRHAAGGAACAPVPVLRTPDMPLSPHGPLKVGIGGPVGAGKTTLTAALARALKDRLSLAVITNDIYTREDAEALMRMQILPADRVVGVETGGCPHTAIREDASINLAAVADLCRGIRGSI